MENKKQLLKNVERKKKANREFIYNTFFRPNPPSIVRLACIQLIMVEGLDFITVDRDKVWNLIWDRALLIRKKIKTTKKVKNLYKELLNERAF